MPVRMIPASRHRRAPPPDVAAAAAWTTPRDINSLEWFASANDICRVYASLATPRLPAGPGPRSARCFRSTTAAWLSTRPVEDNLVQGRIRTRRPDRDLATTRTGHSYVVTALAGNPSQPINEATAVPIMASAVKGAFTLPARR